VSIPHHVLLLPSHYISPRKDGSRPEGLLFPMLIDVSEQEDGSLQVEVEYSTKIFSSELAANIQKLVQGLLPST
jgi:hypothetical protein